MSEVSEVKLHFLDYWRVIRVRFGIILLAFLLVVITVGVTVYFMPRLYKSTAVMEIKADQTTMKVFNESGSRGWGETQRFNQTQFQIIQRKGLLYKVIDNFKLDERWSKGGQRLTREQAYWKLRGALDIDEIRNTDLIEISVYSQDPQEAAELANSIASVYRESRIEEQREVTASALAQLKEELHNQEDKVEKAREGMIRIQKEQNLPPDISSDTSEGMESTITRMVVSKTEEVQQAKTKLTTLRAQREKVERLTDDELMRALAQFEIPDPTVQKIQPLYQDVVAEKGSLLKSGLGSKHPLVQGLESKERTYAAQLKEQMASIRSSLNSKVDFMEKSVAETERQLEGMKTEQHSTAAGSADYITAKRKYLEEKKVMEGARMRFESEMIERSIPLKPSEIREKAEASLVPAKPKVGLYMTAAVLAGIVVGIALAFFIEYLDTSVKTLEDVETYLGVPVLAVIPKNIKLLHKEPSDTPDAEAYRILRTNIEFNRKSADANAISMVSGGPGEGKSTTLANLAFTCAQGGYNVLVVDADLRRPTQHSIWEMGNDVGLSNYLTTDMQLEDVIVPTSVDNLYLLPSGMLPSDAVGILNSQRMSHMISEVKGRFDIVFFDSPPILGVSDASVLASEVDLSIIVVQHRRFPRSMLQRVKQAVINVGGTVLGVVLNNVDVKHDQYYQYYTSYYDYYTPKDRKTMKTKQTGQEAGVSNPGGKEGSGEDY